MVARPSFIHVFFLIIKTMSKVTLNSPVKTLSGTLNRQSDLVFVTRHRTEHVSTRTLESSSPHRPSHLPHRALTHDNTPPSASCMDAQSSSPSPAQQQTRENFAILRRQAQYILATPSLRDSYLRQWAKQRKYHTLLGFIMHSLSSPDIEH